MTKSIILCDVIEKFMKRDQIPLARLETAIVLIIEESLFYVDGLGCSSAKNGTVEKVNLREMVNTLISPSICNSEDLEIIQSYLPGDMLAARLMSESLSKNFTPIR